MFDILFFYLAKALKTKRGRLVILLAKAKNKGKCSCFIERFEEHKSDSLHLSLGKRRARGTLLLVPGEIFSLLKKIPFYMT